MTGNPHRVGRGLASVAAMLVLFVAVPVGLVSVARSRFGGPSPIAGVPPPGSWDLDRVRDALVQPLGDDALVDVLIRVSLLVVWLAIVVIAVTVVTEMAHMLRHRGLPSPDVRGAAWAQGLGRWIAVGLIALLPLQSSASAGSPTGEGPAATAERLRADAEAVAVWSSEWRGDNDDETTPAHGIDVVRVSLEADDPTPPRIARVRADLASTDSGVHVVERGESIYSIAAAYRHANEAEIMGYAEAILDLNLGTVMNDGQRFTNPALVQPGWVLELPDRGARGARSRGGSPGATDSTIHLVEPGESLSSIAEQHLGDAGEWPEIWERNRDADMGGGHRFDDPDLILPGWQIEVPDESGTPTPGPGTPGTGPADTDTPISTDGGETRRSPARGGDPEPDTVRAPVPGPRQVDGPTTPFEPPTSAPTDVASPAPAPGTTTAPTGRSTTPDAGPTTSTTPVSGQTSGPDSATSNGNGAPRAPSPIRLEHAALMAAGVLTLVGVRRRRALRAALPHARVPPPPPDVAATERRLRTLDPGEREARIDIAVRAAAHHIAETGVQVGSIRIARDGELTMRLTGDGHLGRPWTGSGATWTLPASVPIEMLGDDARMVGQPCLALVTIGIDTDGRDVLIDLEAAGLTTIEAGLEQADEVVRAIGSGLATSLESEVVHLVVASLGAGCLFDHPNARELHTADQAIAAATDLVGSTLGRDRSSFDLRSRRTGGEMWEPAVVLLATDDAAADRLSADGPRPGHGVALVAACGPGSVDRAGLRPGARLVGHADRWQLSAFGEDVVMSPIGLTADDVAQVEEVLADAARPIEPDPPTPAVVEETVVTPLNPPPHDIVVGLMGPVAITSIAGEPGDFERSKTVELIAWLATHRERATRGAARTALWEMDVRDATFANVVSEARRGLGRLVPPPGGDEWLARTLNETLPLHPRVVTDAELIEYRVDHARLAPPAHAINVLRPAVEMIRGIPFENTAYLWPDADGITSNLVLLATTAAAELAGHALSIGDTELVFWSTGQGLKVLPGHEELIALRMRAHARAGDLAGVRQEWESYERVITADSWSDGEPAPKLLSLRRALLSPT